MSQWIDTNGEPPVLPPGTVIVARGRYDDEFGPLPVELLNPEAWSGNMFYASQDLIGYRLP